MAKFGMDITGFTQHEYESLYEIWERFTNLQRRCPPPNGLPDWLVIQTFYNDLNYPTKINIDTVVGGALRGKSTEDAQTLIEEMVSNNY